MLGACTTQEWEKGGWQSARANNLFDRHNVSHLIIVGLIRQDEIYQTCSHEVETDAGLTGLRPTQVSRRRACKNAGYFCNQMGCSFCCGAVYRGRGGSGLILFDAVLIERLGEESCDLGCLAGLDVVAMEHENRLAVAEQGHGR